MSVQPSSRPSYAAARESAPAAGDHAGHAPALWRLLQASAAALQAVRAGQSTTRVLEHTDAPLRPGVQALLFQTLRQLGRAQALRTQLAQRAPAPAVDALLCTALALVWDAQAAPYPPHTLVSQAVEAAKRSPAMRGQSGFVNACLRRFLRDGAALVQATDADPVARWNHPAWWIERLRSDWPQQWQDILRANNAQPPMVLRVAVHRGTQQRYLQRLQDAGIAADAVGSSGVALHRPLPVTQLPGWNEGVVSVQDGAAQLAAPLLLQGLDAQRPLRLLDACAAPGGKTAHLLECAVAQGAPWHVTALEVDPQRARRIDQTLQRLGLLDPARAQVLVADAGQPRQWLPQAGNQLFDAILLDAPCTASGIVRRHPDVRWLRRESDIAQLAAQQERLLEALWPLLAPGGRLLYCTCSVFRSEGSDQVQAFVARHTDARMLPSPGHLLPRSGPADAGVPDNGAGEHDGFFYALLHKG